MVSVAERLIDLLSESDVKYVFGVPSGAWTDYMEVMRSRGVEFVLVANEASAGFMADVCARITGVPGVCYGTLGPGATNLSTGVGCAFLDRSPVLAFTTEAPDAMRNRTMQMKIDHQTLFKPITKWTTRLRADEVDETVYRALHVATSEVPGPVHVGLPSDLSSQPAGDRGATPFARQEPASPDPAMLDRLEQLFRDAEKPILAVGLTAVRSGVQDLILRIAEKHTVPVVLTPMAKGMVPEDHPAYAGVLFHALSNYVAATHQQADLVIGVGYDPVEFNYEDWLPDAPLIHIDTVPADLDQTAYTLALDVVGALRPALERLAEVDAGGTAWDFEVLAERRQEMFQRLQPADEGAFGPRAALTILREVLPENGVMTCDVGAHTHLIGQLWRTPAPGLQVMTNGWSSMGFGIPSAIAAKLCLPDQPVACVTGDGGFQMMVGEMATAMRLGAHVVFVLLTDRNLELIRFKQERKGYPRYGTPLYDEAYVPSDRYFGVPVMPAHTAKSYRAALEEALAADGPVIVEAFVDGSEYDDLILKPHKG